ncbi:MAG: magnesium transporter [Candidatus Obscuribacterales bacterium]|nr:magnesium transporter [Candidatus Obscuribacterales bacterium]
MTTAENSLFQHSNVAGTAFEELSVREQAERIGSFCPDAQRLAMRVLDPDDAADLLQSLDHALRAKLLALLDFSARAEVTALLAYAEDVAGGLMNPRFIRVRPHMTAQEAIMYVRKQVAANPATSSYVYVLNSQQKLMGVISMKELLMVEGKQEIQQIMRSKLVTLPESCAQDEVANIFAKNHLIAIPVLDGNGCMKGVVTADDVVNVVRSEATEDMQKMGGSEALDMPYLTAKLPTMIRKRGGWLIMLFIGELLTASAMAHFQDEIAKAVILALFVPLIISSGGNAGSQASTLVIRAMALGEVKLRDWFRVMKRELVTGLSLGIILGLLGFIRVVAWEQMFHIYGPHSVLIGLTVAISLVGVVLWGSVTGSVLPFLLRRLGFDPASASTPFVATLVDVTGLVIYFSVASAVLMGKLL